MENQKNKYHSYIKFSGIGIQMAATIALMGWLGSLIDSRWQADKPYATLLFLLFGTCGAIFLLIRQLAD